MFSNIIKRIVTLLFCIIITLLLCSCGNKADENSSVVAGNNKTPIAIEQENDIVDPENTDLVTEEGAKVTTQQFVKKTGKANGIDVSKWQGKIDWKKVKNSGVNFAIIRMGYRGEDGKIYKDSYADYNIQQADKADVLVGVYFFSTAINTNEAIEEANWLVSAIEGYPISYPVVYNSEGFLNENSRMNGLSKEQRTDNAVAFLNYVKSKGYESMFYASKTELENSKHWNTSKLENLFMIWVARYPKEPYPKTDSPDYSGKYDMWQYTDKGVVDGIGMNTDMIVSYFTRDKKSPKNSEIKNEIVQAPKPTDKIYTNVNDQVTAKIEVNLRKEATSKSDVMGTLKNGTFLKRIATGSNGWSKLEFNGQIVYAITSYLTTDKDYKQTVSEPVVNDGFTASSGQVTAKDKTNLRSEPNTDSTLVATIKNGEFVERIATSPKGWTRLLYNGQTVYAKTSLLTTEIKTETSKSQASTDKFTAMGGKVTAKLSETNLRTGPTTNGTQIVYTLKKGEFVERTGEYNGWTRMNYNGQTVYAISSYLLTEEEYNTQSQQ